MALFARATSIFIVSNKNYSKLVLPTVKSKTWKNHASKFTLFEHPILNVRFLHSDQTKKDGPETFVTFDKFLKDRRDEAKRSILVQVNTESSLKDLHFYCSTFGEIKCMFYYVLSDSKSHHVLVEFEKVESVDAILKSATHIKLDQVIPVHSSMLYLRKLKAKHLHAPKLKFPVKYAKHPVKDKHFLEVLQNAKTASQQVQKCYSILKLDDLGLRLRFQTARQLERCFSGIFPDMEALPFGSSVNGFGKMGCDLDLYINFSSNRSENEESRLVFQTKRLQDNDRHQCSDFVRIIGDLIEIFAPGVFNVTKILKARVPIVKFDHRITGVECDLSLSNMSAVYMSELLYLYGEIDWRVRPVIFTIRKWAQSQGITSENPGGCITNFSLTLLILFYLQQKKVLPTLLELRSKALRSDLRITDTNVDCTFLRDISKLRNVEPHGEDPYSLLQGFFDYYASFDFKVNAICLRQGTVLRKKDSSPIYICNPLEPGLNVSRNVTYREMENLRAGCREASWRLENSEKKLSDNSWGIISLFLHKVKHTNTILNVAEVMRDKESEEEESDSLLASK